MKHELVIEIGSEELPAGEVLMAVDSLKTAIVKGLDEARLEHGEAKTYATPRRLAVVVPDVDAQQADLTKEVSGPPVKFAFKDGKPTKAAEGFAKGLGLTVDDLERRDTKKGEYLFAVVEEKGRAASDLIAELVAPALSKIPFKRTMRWGTEDAAFVRPIQWIVAVLGDQVLDVKFADVTAGRQSRGHRFLAPEPFDVTGGEQYVSELLARKVIGDVAERRSKIVGIATELAKESGGTLRPDEELVDEVTQLVEWPVGMLCEFDKKYLEIPHEVLISEMREHQRYLAIVDEQGKLHPHFVVIANTEVKDEAVVKGGYQRVLTARFSDGVFFYEEDKKTPLIERVDGLKSVQFHRALGSIYEKVERIVSLATQVAVAVGRVETAESDDWRAFATDAEDGWLKNLVRAGFLMKTDLISKMVYEFPDLQGSMGRAYAELNGEDPAVALAIEEHYLPRFAGDELPTDDIGALLGIGDRLDTIVGIFTTGKGPTGAADPYGLRRAVLGILHILRDRDWHVDLRELVKGAQDLVEGKRKKKDRDEVFKEVGSFVRGRLKGMLVSEGVPTDVAEAALSARGSGDPVDAAARAHALAKLRDGDDFEPIAATFKRVGNILKKEKSHGSRSSSPSSRLDASTLTEDAERALYDISQSISARVASAIEDKKFDEAFVCIAEVRPLVDKFFDTLMVLHEDPAIRGRRVKLLRKVQKMFASLADFTKLSA